MIARILALLVLCAANGIAVPNVLNHQGRIAINGVNHDGSGHFKFALVDATGAETFWTNDGTITGEPATAIAITVSKGHYAILLGETNPIDPSIFDSHDDLRLRTWFSSDNLSFTLLTPDRRLTPSPYAFTAATAMSITPGYETGSGTQFALQSVDGNQLRLDASFSQSFATGPTISIDDDWTVDTTSESGFTATTSFRSQTIDPGGLTGTYASLAVINGRPAISYRDDEDGDLYYIRSVDPAGSNWPASSITKVDGVLDDVGQFTTLAEIDGRPAIAYYDLTHGSLQFVRAHDAGGTSWQTPVTVDGVGSSNVGRDASLAVIGGVPAISYQSPNTGEIVYAWAADAAGISWPTINRIAIEGSPSNYRQHTSLIELANGKPAIAFHSQTGGDLRYAYLSGSDPAILADWSFVNVAPSGDEPTLTLIDGNPAIAYGAGTTVRYTRSVDADGTAWTAPITIDTNASQPSLADIGGHPAISYYDSAGGNLKLALASDVTGSAWPSTNLITIDGASANVGTHSSLARVAGLPAIAYHNSSTSDLNFASLPTADWSASIGGAEPILASGVKDGGITTNMLAIDIGTWSRSGDDLFYDIGRVGIGRLATNNALEVEGSVSKSTAGSWAANSDRRIKTDIRSLDNALERILAIRLVEFNYTEEYLEKHPTIAPRRYPNVIAQEFAEVFPGWVQLSGERLPGGDEPILQVDTYPIIIFTAAAVQELAEENAELRTRLERLEKLVEKLSE